ARARPLRDGDRPGRRGGRPRVLRLLPRLPQPGPGRAVLRRRRRVARDRAGRRLRLGAVGRRRTTRAARPPVGPDLRRGPAGGGRALLHRRPAAPLVPAVGRPRGRRALPPAHRHADGHRRVRAGAARHLGDRAPPRPAAGPRQGAREGQARAARAAGHGPPHADEVQHADPGPDPLPGPPRRGDAAAVEHREDRPRGRRAMTAHDRTANEPGTAHLRVCPRPDDADVAAAVVADPHLDRATAARLRDTSRRTRPRIERYLLAAGHLSATGSASDGGRPGGGRRRSTVVPLAPAGRATPPVADEGPDVVDQRRDLTRRDQVILALVEQIDELHRRRVDSPSARERQIAAKALGEALYRSVAGYQADYEPPRRAVLALRRADRALGRACERLAARGPRRQALVRWWARVGQWVRLLLAVASLVLLWHQVLVAAAVTVGARALLSAGLYSPAPPPSRRQQVLGYDPGWVVVFYTHAGDAAILTGLGVGLHMAGHTVWGIASAFAGLIGVIAAM